MKLEKLKTPILYVLVGLPGSGKSTWIKNNCDSSFVIISTDNELEALAESEGSTYNEAFNKHYELAATKAKARFAKALKDNANIVWDQTNLSISKRRKVLSQVPRRYNKICVVFTLSREELNARLDKRHKETGKFIPQSVVDDMEKIFSFPTENEGFDKIIEV